MADMRSVGVVGGGQMGSGIAQLAAVHGLEVWLHDSDAGVITRAYQTISSRIQLLVSKRILTKEKGAEAIRNLRCTSTLEDFCSVEIVIEAIVESEEVKKNLFAKLDKIVKSSAILASNTSSISITRLGSATNRPSQIFCAMAFVSLSQNSFTIDLHQSSLGLARKLFVHKISLASWLIEF